MYTVYSTDSCSFCDKAIDALKRHGLEFNKVDITADVKALEFMKENGFRTVPQIYHNDEHIGGYTELMQSLT